MQSARLKNEKNDNRSKEKANNARDNNGTIHNKRISNKAQDTNETIQQKRELTVREILTQQLFKRES